jgi:hypothetical protein
MIEIRNSIGATMEVARGKIPYSKTVVKKMLRSGYTFWIPENKVGGPGKKLSRNQVLALAKES